MPTISVIVPVYKVEEYLPACIRSILRQTYRDFELILVDDGSPDRCGEICDEFAKQDERIRVIHQENGGVSKARNIGLETASGDWVCFVDSDDEISMNFLAGFMDNYFAEDYDPPVDYMIQGSCYIDNGGIILRKRWKSMRYSIKDFLTSKQGIPKNVWGSIFRKSNIVQYQITFQENLSNAEDSLFVSSYLLHVSTIITLDQIGYFYRRDRIDSASRSIKGSKPFILSTVLYLKNIYALYGRYKLICKRPDAIEIRLLKNLLIMNRDSKELREILFSIRSIQIPKHSRQERKRDRFFFILITYFPFVLIRMLLNAYHIQQIISTKRKTNQE